MFQSFLFDSTGGDLAKVGKLPLDELIDRCIANEDCVAFNTLGFLKRKVGLLCHSPYFGPDDRLYIHQERHQRLMHKLMNKPLPLRVVNLLRRPDRKKQMQEKLLANGINPAEIVFVPAVDGQELKATPELFDLFNGNDFGSRRGMIGCALSHYRLWQELAQSENDPWGYRLIIEDDLTFGTDFLKRLNSLKPYLEDQEILLMGYSMFDCNRAPVEKVYQNDDAMVNVKSLNKNLFIGGTFCYSINQTGARKFCDYIARNGIKHGIDYLFKKPDMNIEVRETQPQLVFSPWNEGGREVDTDIQNRYDPLIWDELELDDRFVFHRGLDAQGHDLSRNRANLKEMQRMALADPSCLGFNTLGYFKYQIDVLTPSPYFGSNDGIFIKKDVIARRRLRVKLLANWASPEEVCEEFSNMCEKDRTYDNLQLVSDDKADYFVIINRPRNGDYYIPEKTVIFQGEPWCYDDHPDLRQ